VPDTGTQAASGEQGGVPTAKGSSITITSIVTRTNADGSITTITGYADGSSAISTEPKPTYATGKLSTSNGGQLSTLLTAQSQTSTDATGYASYVQPQSAKPSNTPGRLSA
jgi:hypothetical protein